MLFSMLKLRNLDRLWLKMVILRSFLIKSYVAPKRVVIFSLPYTGLHSIQIRKQIIKLFSSAYPRISTTMYFSTGTKIVISFFFNLKIAFLLVWDCALFTNLSVNAVMHCISVKLFAIFIRAFRNTWEFRLVLANLSQNLPSLTFCHIINLLAILLNFNCWTISQEGCVRNFSIVWERFITPQILIRQ